MNLYAEIAEHIIRQQETIIGPVAVEQAEQVTDLDVDWKNHKVSVKGDGKKAINELVDQYRELFGRTSVEVCKEAARKYLSKLPPQEVPSLLR